VKPVDPITDLYILVANSVDAKCPSGYIKVGININIGTKSNTYTFLCFTRASGIAVTDVSVTIIKNSFGANPQTPAGFSAVPSNYATPVNLNTGTDTNSDLVYLWYKKGGPGKKLEQITILDTKYSDQNEGCRAPWILANANLNSGNQGDPLFVCAELSLV